MIEKGQEAPDFELPDQDGRIVKLSDFRGQSVVVYFYPKADTPGCTTQACGVRDHRGAYEAAVEARRLQEQSVSVEQQTFAVGLSTNLIVIQYQNYLAQARSTEVASKGAYTKAKLALQRATGATLDSHHVAIDEAYRGSVTRPSGALPAPTP